MNGSEMKTIAGELVDAGAPALPTVLLAREVPVFEVEFTALEFVEEARLPSSDWATLALARALGEITPADVDAYLGLGEAVSEGIVRRLLEAELLVERAESVPPHQDEAGGLTVLFRRLFRRRPPADEAPPQPNLAPTAARKLRESHASTSPTCRLSAVGGPALERGAIARRRVRPARLLFLSEPLLFLGVVDEKRHRHAQHRRPVPLDPEFVPNSLHVIDATLALPPAERVVACGIDSGIGGFSGQLVGVVPGTQWEVLRVERRGGRGREPQVALLLVAAFPSTDEGGVRWRVYLRQQGQTQDCAHVDPATLVGPELRSFSPLLSAVKTDSVPPDPESLRADGAFEIRCDAGQLPGLLGEADRPDDAYLPALAERWWVGLRAHAMPSSTDAGHAAFYEFLGRREADLRRDFDATCTNLVTSLNSYWGEVLDLPSPGEAASSLWTRAELRAAICMRRRHADLVSAYEATDGKQ